LERLDEVAEKIAMGPFGSSIKVETFVDSGIPVVSGAHLRNVKLADKDFNYVREEHAKRLINANVQRGDVLFTHAGNIGQVSYIPEDSEFDRYVISQRQFYLRPNRERVLPDYLAYYFRSPRGRHQLLANTSSTGVPSIAQPVTYLRSLRIPLPALKEQRAIAEVLGALDDKTENCTGLATRADLLFHAEWERRFGHLQQQPSDTRLSDLCTTQYGYTASAVEEPMGPRLLRVTDINKANWVDWNRVPWCLADEPAQKRFGLYPGDLLVARMADPGKSALVEVEVDAVFASYLVRLSPLDRGSSRFLFGFLKSRYYTDYAATHSGGSVQKNMNAKVIAAASVRLPSNVEIAGFDAWSEPMRETVSAALNEAWHLARLRNALLPPLMSGELRVRDAEELVEGVV
jgi:type I restriction enzyme, S subunit